MRDIVTFNATFNSDCASFNETIYKHRLAAALTGIEPEHIMLTVMCSSVFVTFTILTPDRPTAEAILAALSTTVTASEAMASQVLGANIMRVSFPEFGEPVIIAPAGSGAPADDSLTEAGVLSRWMLLLILSVSSLLVACVAGLLVVYVCCRRRYGTSKPRRVPPTMLKPKTPASSGAMAQSSLPI